MSCTLCRLSLAFLGCALLNACSTAHFESEDGIYLLRYGQSSYSASEVFEQGSGGTVPFAWYFGLMRSRSDLTLIDCGIRQERLARQWSIAGFTEQVTLLARIGVQPEDITRVILTHLHADHVDGCAAFTHAQFFVQKREFDSMNDAFASAGEGKVSANGYRREHLDFLTSLQQEGRLTLVDGNETITPSLSTELHPFHTAGMQAVIVDAGSGQTVAFVSDNAYVMDNVTQEHPIGAARDIEGDRDYLRMLHAWQSPLHIIIPGHDSSLFYRSPEVATDIVRVR
ncbi:MAG: MBL fold metallo-hydrolase [Candidatus Peregrinibacteria bacterium]